MITVPTPELKRTAYFMPGMVPAHARQTLKSESSQGLKPNVAISDLSLAYPEAVVQSSEPRGWLNVRAFEVRQTASEWTLPPIENHCIIVQLGPPVDVSASIGSEGFTRSLKPGECIIIPAGSPLTWHQMQTMPNRMLFLYLHPNLLRNTAESLDVDFSQISIAPQFGIRDEHIRHV